MAKDGFYLSDNELSLSMNTFSDEKSVDELEKILLKMLYRISKEEDHVINNAGHVA